MTLKQAQPYVKQVSAGNFQGISEFKIDLLQIECSLENSGFGILNVKEEKPTNLSMQINV